MATVGVKRLTSC